MALDRLMALIVEIKQAVDKVQAAIDQRPLLQAAIDALKAKVAEAEKAAAEAEPPPAQ